MVLPKLNIHLNKENILSDHGSIGGHRNVNETERSSIDRYRNFNVLKICKTTVVLTSSKWRGIIFSKTVGNKRRKCGEKTVKKIHKSGCKYFKMMKSSKRKRCMCYYPGP